MSKVIFFKSVYYWVPYFRLMMMVLSNLGETSCRVVIKILSCRVNTTSGQEIKQPGISFGSVFLSFLQWKLPEPGDHIHSSGRVRQILGPDARDNLKK